MSNKTEIKEEKQEAWFRHTAGHAGRFKTHFDSMPAEMALGRSVSVRIHIDGVIGTSLHAGLAANAAEGIEIHDRVFALVHGAYRTNLNARRFFAVVAAVHLEDASHVRKSSLLHVFDPGPVDAQWDSILGFACHRTGVAADALAVVDDESVSHFERPRDEE